MNYIVVAFFFTDTHTTEIYTLSLHDALPISETFVGLLCKEKKVLLLQSSNTSGSPDGQDNQRSAVYPCRRNTPQNPSLSRGEKKICRHADAGNNRLPNDLRERDPAEEPRDGDVVLATIHQS